MMKYVNLISKHTNETEYVLRMQIVEGSQDIKLQQENA